MLTGGDGYFGAKMMFPAKTLVFPALCRRGGGSEILEFTTVQNGREILGHPVRGLAGKYDTGFWRQNDVMRFKAHLF